MSDLPQGPGWWRASDGRYYPPEARPAENPDENTTQGAPLDTPGQDSGVPESVDPEPPSDRPERLGEPADPTAVPVDPTVVDGPPVVPVDPDRTEWAADWGTDRGIPGDGIAASPTGGGGSGPDEPVDPNGGWDDDEPPRRSWLFPVIALVIIVAIAAGIGIWLMLQDDDDGDDTASTTTEVPDTGEPIETGEPTETSQDTTTTTEDDEVSVYELGVGDCFDTIEVEEGDGLLITTVELVDCEDPHQAEIFSVETLDDPSGAEFPGTEARDAAAQALCEPGFGEFVGVPLAESELLLWWLAPTQESWTEDDREVACVVAAPDGEMLTGTSAGVAR